jgi:hypothetical protein
MRPQTHFEIEFATSESSDPVKARLHDGADVLDFVKEKLRPGSELLVACLGDGVDYGNLILDFDLLGGVSLRALEHSGFAVHRVSSEQALQALEYWLPAQERLPSLQWTEE